MWMFLIERYKLSNILYAIRSMRPAFSLSSAFSLPFSTNYCPTCLIVVLIISNIAWIRYSPLMFSLENWQRTKTDYMVMTNGLPNKFFHGILILSPLILECFTMMGSWYFWNKLFFNLMFLISILPEKTPTFSSFESISYMNSPKCSFRIFYRYF